MGKTTTFGGQTLLLALSTALAVILFMVLSASCGSSKNGASIASWPEKPSAKAVSTPDFSEQGVVNEDGIYSSIAYDPDGNPAIAFITSSSLYYAAWDGTDWDNQTEVSDSISSGKCVSLAFNSSGCPSIAYNDSTALMWAFDEDDDGDWNDNANWPMEIASDVGYWNGYADHRNCSHDISGNEYGFAFYDAEYHVLRYFQYNIATSQAALVDVDTSAFVGRYCSLKFSNGTPSIAYYDYTNGSLKFATEDSPYWDIEPLDAGTGALEGQYASLSYKSSGVPTIAFYVEYVFQAQHQGGHPYLATWNSSTSEWDYVCLNDSANDYGAWMSLDWDPTGAKAGFSFEYQTTYHGYPAHELRFMLYDGQDYTLYNPGTSWGGLFTTFIWEDGDIGWISDFQQTPNSLSPPNQDLGYVMVDDS
jgi:hypothetical protein